MKKIFYVRHQAAGVLHEHPFDATPSAAEVEAIRVAQEERFGKKHPKTGQAWWASVVEVEMLTAAERAARDAAIIAERKAKADLFRAHADAIERGEDPPPLQAPGDTSSGSGALADLRASGTGHVDTK